LSSALFQNDGLLETHGDRKQVLRSDYIYLGSTGIRILYSSIGFSNKKGNRRKEMHRAKIELLTELLKHPTLVDFIEAHPMVNSQENLVITSDRWGKPVVMTGKQQLLSLSFSSSDNKIWCLICTGNNKCGIDAARFSEFDPGYPHYRAFLKAELSGAADMTCGEISDAAALLWSGKEAIVKALGCAFRLVDPLGIRIYIKKLEGDTCWSSAELLKSRINRSGVVGEPGIVVKSRRHGDDWVSIAAVSREFHDSFWQHQILNYGLCLPIPEMNLSVNSNFSKSSMRV
jgi:phosphopantetheinyl transferase